jgi:hypothetical protein
LADDGEQGGSDTKNGIFWAHAGKWSGVAPADHTPTDFTGSVAFLKNAGDAAATLFVAAPWGVVNRSTDAGKSWQQIDSGNPNQKTVALLVVPEIHAVLAAKSVVEGYSYEGAEGVFLSQDKGETWADLYELVRGIEESPRIFGRGQILAVSPRQGLSVGIYDDERKLAEMYTGQGWRFHFSDQAIGWSGWDLEQWRDKYEDYFTFSPLSGPGAPVSKTDRVTALAIADLYRFSANTAEPGMLRGEPDDPDTHDDDREINLFPIAQQLGQVTALAVTIDAGQIYAATADNMIWQSTDLGESWAEFDDSFTYLAGPDQHIRMITLSADGKPDWVGLVGAGDADFYRLGQGNLTGLFYEAERKLQHTSRQLTALKATTGAQIKDLNGKLTQAEQDLSDLQAKYDKNVEDIRLYKFEILTKIGQLKNAAKEYAALKAQYDTDVGDLNNRITQLQEEISQLETEKHEAEAATKAEMAALKRQAKIDQDAAVRANQSAALLHQKRALQIAAKIAADNKGATSRKFHAELKKAHDAAIRHQEDALKIAAKIAADAKGAAEIRQRAALKKLHQNAIRHQKNALKIAAKIAADEKRVTAKAQFAQLKKAHDDAIKHQEEALKIAAKIAADAHSATEKAHLAELKTTRDAAVKHEKDALKIADKIAAQGLKAKDILLTSARKEMARQKTTLGRQISTLTGTVSARDVRIDDLNGKVVEQSHKIDGLNDTVKERDGTIKTKNKALERAGSDAVAAKEKADDVLNTQKAATDLAAKKWNYVRDLDLRALLPRITATDLTDYSGFDNNFTSSKRGGVLRLQSPDLSGKGQQGLTVEVFVDAAPIVPGRTLITISHGGLTFRLGVAKGADHRVFVELADLGVTYISSPGFIPPKGPVPWVFCLRPDKGALMPEVHVAQNGIRTEFRGKLKDQTLGAPQPINQPVDLHDPNAPTTLQIDFPAQGKPPCQSLLVHSRALTPDAIQRNMTHGQLDK